MLRILQVNNSERSLLFHFVKTYASVSILGPVVQSVVSLTSLLRVISLTVLADSMYNILIFFAEKMRAAFALLTFFFSKKFQHICVSLDVNFNESLTNDIVSFEQLDPAFLYIGLLSARQVYFQAD